MSTLDVLVNLTRSHLSIWHRLVRGCQYWGSSSASLGNRLCRAPDLHGVLPPSGALCQTLMQTCWCTQIWKEKKKTHLKVLTPFYISCHYQHLTIWKSVLAKYKEFNRIKLLCDTFPPCVSDPETIHQSQYTQDTWTFSWGSPKKTQSQHHTSQSLKQNLSDKVTSDKNCSQHATCLNSPPGSHRDNVRFFSVQPISHLQHPPQPRSHCTRVNVCGGAREK